MSISWARQTGIYGDSANHRFYTEVISAAYDILASESRNGTFRQFDASAIDRSKAAYALFHDDLSQRTFLNQLAIRWTMTGGSIDPISTQQQPDQYFPAGIYRHRPDEVFVDCGAFDGDTLEVFRSKGPFRHAYAFEADPANFAKLIARGPEFLDRVTAVNIAVGAEWGDATFNLSGTAQSHFCSGIPIHAADVRKVRVGPIDELIGEYEPTLIKADIEAMEPQALKGAEKTIRRCNPMLSICVYHWDNVIGPSQFWELPLMIKEMCPDYRFYLRHHGTIHCEVVMYAVPPGRATK